MGLPKLLTPEFETVIPSTKEPIRFRPFLVKEEKILYMALESNEQKEVFNAVMKLLKSCILTPGVNYDKLTSYDLEYLFLMLRAKSVGEVIEVKVRHSNKEFLEKCDHSTDIEINLEKIEVKFDDNHNNIIQLNDNIGLKLRDPKASMFSGGNAKKSEIDNIMSIIYSCVESVYDEETVYTEFTLDELKEFIDGLNKDQFAKIIEFFNTIPQLAHDISFTCEKCNEKETVRIEGLQSFFT